MNGYCSAGGWCAPSEHVYDFGVGGGPLPEAACPAWNGITQDECETRSLYEGGVSWKNWHDCKDEFNGPHKVCVCEDCGAERVVLT